MNRLWEFIFPAIFLIALSALCSCGYKTKPRPTTVRVPAQIKIINATGFPNDITLSWNAPALNADGSKLTDLSGFKVYRGSRGVDEDCQNCQDKRQLYANIDFQSPTNAVIKNNEVTFQDKDVAPGKVYSYSVTAFNLKGRESGARNAIEVFYETTPTAPTNLTAKPEAGHIRLEWTAPSDEKIDRFRILRGSDNDIAKMKSIGTAPQRELWYVDKNVEKGDKFFYAVRSVKSHKGTPFESNTSNIAEAAAPSVYWGSPENVNLAMTNQGIRVYWEPVKIDNEETNYNIYRSESGHAFQKINTVALKEPWFLNNKVSKGRPYRYAVTAFPKGRPDEESAKTASQALRYAF
ncbi:MAG: fibronectin type III domain-containing protein [Desulfomonilaceae bacterium]